MSRARPGWTTEVGAERSDSLKKTVTDPVRLEPAAGKTAPEKTWVLSIAGEGSARLVAVSPEVVLAGHVLETLDADPRVLSKDVSITIKGRSVQLEGRDDAHVNATAAKLGRLEGVSGVNVRVR